MIAWQKWICFPLFSYENVVVHTECPKINVPHLCGYCGGDVDSIIAIFTLLHRSGFNLEFESFLSQSDTWLLIYGREKAK